MRDSDVGIVLPTGGVLAASGATGSVTETIAAAGIETAVEGDEGFTRDPDRSAPYNLMVNVQEVTDAAESGPPSRPYLDFGELADGATGQSATEMTVAYPQSQSQWTFDSASGRWARSDIDEGGYDFTNVIVLMVDTTDAGYLDPAGNPVPVSITEGTGEGYLATDSQVYAITWEKTSESGTWSFSATDEQGVAVDMPVPPGRSWVSLLPTQGGSFSFSGGMPSEEAGASDQG